MALTDAQIDWLFDHRLSHSNGRICGRRLNENGVAGTEYTCAGKTKIVNGVVLFTGTCGEPCTFVCNDADAYRKSVETLRMYEKLIEEAKAKA